MENGLTGIIPFNYFKSTIRQTGSTSLRVDNLVEIDNNFEKFIHGKKYQNLIFQKAYWNSMMDLYFGPKILDICDPDWVHEQRDIVEIGTKVHAITCSSETMTEQLRVYFPNKIVEHVPDRFNFNTFPEPKTKYPENLINATWFGYINNAKETLGQFASRIKKYNLKLRIIADRAYDNNDEISTLISEFQTYNHETIYKELLKSDIILNPKSTKAFYKYKSNNKSLISWKLGIPVAETPEELDILTDAKKRMEQVDNRNTVMYKYDIKKRPLSTMI